MFWNKIKSKEFTELMELIVRQSTRISALEIDLQLYVKKLKASKGLKDKEDEEVEKTKDIYGGMFLPDNDPKFRKH